MYLPTVLADHLLETKNELKKIKEMGDSTYIYQNKLDKACFQQFMPYRDFKDWSRRAASDKVLRDKAFDTAKIQNMVDMK